MNRARPILAALAVLALSPGDVQAQTTQLFPRRAEVDDQAMGLLRVELPAELVVACGPSLGDLRVIDDTMSSLPYVIDAAPRTGSRVTLVGATPAEARQRVETRSNAPRLYREEYDLDLPPAS
ncbi:MAG: hypothetical protein H5U40_17960, partial [Polyangiaceae bacterium]|nr:hypothetical protein [Polyangiaceae bacterium]